MSGLSCRAIQQFSEWDYWVLERPWQIDTATFRLAGYLNRFYDSLFMAYEINPQSAHRHLSLAEVKEMGELLVLTAAEFLNSPQAQPLFTNIQKRLAGRQERLEKSRDLLAGHTNALLIEWTAWWESLTPDQPKTQGGG